MDGSVGLAYNRGRHGFGSTMSCQIRDQFSRLLGGNGKEDIKELSDAEWTEVTQILDSNTGSSSRKADTNTNEIICTSSQKDQLEDTTIQETDDDSPLLPSRPIIIQDTSPNGNRRQNDHHESGKENRDHGREQDNKLNSKVKGTEVVLYNPRREPQQNLQSNSPNDEKLLLENENLKTRIQELKGEVADLKKDLFEQDYWITVLARKLLELKKEVEVAKKENKDLKEYQAKAAAALTELRQHSANNAVDDEKVKQDYNSLIYAVSTWTSEYCGAAHSTPLSKEDRQQIKGLTQMPEQYLQNEHLRPLLIQSLIMKYLAADVLNFSEHGGLLWAGGLSQSLRILGSALRYGRPNSIQSGPNRERARAFRYKEYSAWKTKTASLMDGSVQENQRQELVDGYTKTLSMHVQNLVTTAGRNIWKDLRDIVRAAVALDEELFKSRAIFVFDTWADKGGHLAKTGYQFDSAIMRTQIGSEDGKNGMVAEILLAPFLKKIGTADGGGFDKTMYLEKWLVVCKGNHLRKEER